MLIHANENDFEKLINSRGICLVDFFATWCGPCVMLGQELQEVSKQTNDFDIIKIDIDENAKLANKYQIDVVPTMYIFKNGEPIKKLQGYITKNEILNLMNNLNE